MTYCPTCGIESTKDPLSFYTAQTLQYHAQNCVPFDKIKEPPKAPVHGYYSGNNIVYTGGNGSVYTDTQVTTNSYGDSPYSNGNHKFWNHLTEVSFSGWNFSFDKVAETSYSVTETISTFDEKLKKVPKKPEWSKFTDHPFK